MNRTLVSPYFRPHPCASFFIVSELQNIRIELLRGCAAAHLLHSKPVSDNTRPSQDQEQNSSAGCEESSNLVATAEVVAAPKSGGSDGTTFRFSRLDLEASPFSIEIPSDGPCQLEDDFEMMEPMDPIPESSASLNPADIVSTEDAPRMIEREPLPVRPPPISSTCESLVLR